MPSIHIICANCGKSFVAARGEEVTCPYCGKNFTLTELTAQGKIVDADKARSDYATAHGYFDAGDYEMAGIWFGKVRKADPNNFFAEYFYRLSDIRRKRQEGKLCGAEFIMDLLLEPMAKMSYSGQPREICRGFLLNALSETSSLLSALYDTRGAIYGKPEDADSARQEYITMGNDCRRITVADRRIAMLDDEEIGNLVISICETVVKALVRAVSFIPVGKALSQPSAEICSEAKTLYGVFSHFVRSFRPGFTLAGSDAVYAENAAYDEEAVRSIAEYDRINKQNARKGLSTFSAQYDDMIYRCKSAFDYVYNTVFVCPGGNAGGESERALLCDALIFAEQIVMPRVYADQDGLTVTAPDFDSLIAFSRKFGAIAEELKALDKQSLDASIEDIYEKICDSVRLAYNAEQPRMRREIDEDCARKNKMYFHYRNLLFGIVSASAFALTRIVPYTGHRKGGRIRLLKAGKQAADDLLYIFGHRLEEIEKVPKFRRLAELYACINTDLKAMA